MIKMSQEEVAVEAIKHALKALRKRHLVEEGAHAPAIIALHNPLAYQGSEWKEKAETLEFELQQCYKARSRLSEQLVVEVTESRAAKASVQEKESLIAVLKKQVAEMRDECTELKALLEEKKNGLELVVEENKVLKTQLEEMTLKTKKSEAENKMLIDRWVLQKMQEAEHINEANTLHEDMLGQLKASSIQELAGLQINGVIWQSEAGMEYYAESTLPSTCKKQIQVHSGGCASILFEHNSSKLVTGGPDRTIKMWDTTNGSLSHTLHGCLGSVLDLAITQGNKTVIAACSSNQLFVWDVGSGRIHHTLTGHTDKVCAVDASKVSTRYVVSSAYDRTIKVWDLQKGYCTNTIMYPSNCNALCFGMDGRTVCSGHMDGNLRLWDIETGKLLGEVMGHSLALTSISLFRNGNNILTSGKDNVHNLFDIRTLEVCGTLSASGSRVASNWSRSCISPDDSYVAAGSADGSVSIWSIQKGDIVSTLKEHGAPVLCCTWSGLRKHLATSDRNGIVCIWV